MQKVPLTIKGLSYSERQTGAYALLLGEENGPRKLPIIIGGFEAQSIAIALEKMVNPPRPLTHDLFKNIADSFEIKIEEVVIHDIKDGVFFSNLICHQNGKTLIVDSRPSDAVALAIRFGCPIFTTEEVLGKAGLILEKEDEKSSITISPPSTEEEDKPKEKKLSLRELKKQLEEAVKSEDYEKAARLRDQISKYGQ